MIDPADDLDDYCTACDEHPCQCEDDPNDSGIFSPPKLGTSECPGTCDPMCDWCLVSHECPDACGGGDGCPYNGLTSAGGPEHV